MMLMIILNGMGPLVHVGKNLY